EFLRRSWAQTVRPSRCQVPDRTEMTSYASLWTERAVLPAEVVNRERKAGMTHPGPACASVVPTRDAKAGLKFAAHDCWPPSSQTTPGSTQTESSLWPPAARDGIVAAAVH